MENALFSGLSGSIMKEIERELMPFRFEEGEAIIQAGQEPAGLYFIEKGWVELVPAWAGPHRISAVKLGKGPGEYFGEVPLIDRRKRDTEIYAASRVEGQLLPKEVFDRLVKKQPVFLMNLTRQVLNQVHSRDNELIRELARAKTSAEQFIDRLKSLSATIRVLNSTLDLDDLLEIILEEAMQHTGCENGTIYLLDTETREVVSRVVRPKAVGEIRLPVGKGVAGTVASSRRIVNIEDAYEDKRFDPEIDRKTGLRTRNLLALPMQSDDGGVIGVLQLMNKRSGPFTRNDEDFIEAMSAHASLAIEKAQSAERMIRNESLAAVGRLAASIVHDFKTPMSIILGYTQMLAANAEDERSREFLGEIEHQVERMVSMTREVLDYSRNKMEFAFVPVDLIAFLEETLSPVRNDCESHGVTVKVETDLDNREALIDREKMNRAIMNLTSNAVDAMPDGGEILFRLHGDRKMWYLTVRDTGCGISVNQLSHIFEPFRTFGKPRGTGLGLSIVKKIVNGHGGTIRVNSEEGKGTVFLLSLAREPEAEAD